MFGIMLKVLRFKSYRIIFEDTPQLEIRLEDLNNARILPLIVELWINDQK